MTRHDQKKAGYSSMPHLNGDLLCVVDCETTGLVAGHNDLIQLCILPLDGDLNPLESIRPFYVNMKPKCPGNIDRRAATVNNIKMTQLIKTGLEPWAAVDLFEEWFKNINLPVYKKIQPLAHNWPFDREFVREWVGGPKNYEHFFSPRYRDTLPVSLFMNDRADLHGYRIPNPKNNLGYLCGIYDIKNKNVHDALGDCLATAELYKALLSAHGYA